MRKILTKTMATVVALGVVLSISTPVLASTNTEVRGLERVTAKAENGLQEISDEETKVNRLDYVKTDKERIKASRTKVFSEISKYKMTDKERIKLLRDSAFSGFSINISR